MFTFLICSSFTCIIFGYTFCLCHTVDNIMTLSFAGARNPSDESQYVQYEQCKIETSLVLIYQLASWYM